MELKSKVMTETNICCFRTFIYAALVLEFVTSKIQMQAHLRINQKEEKQTGASFHIVCTLVAGFPSCLLKAFTWPDFILLGYFKENCRR